MAVNAKVVLIFGTSKWGWTETYYYQNASTGVPDVIELTKRLAGGRKALLGRGVNIEAARISLAVSKQSTEFLRAQDLPGAQVVPTGDVGNPWMVALARGKGVDVAGNIYRRPFMLRGLPSEWVEWKFEAPVNPKQIPAFNAGFAAFRTALLFDTNGNPSSWGIRITARGAANPRVQILQVTTYEPGARFRIKTLTPQNWLPGDKIHVSGARGNGTEGLNADAIVLGISADQQTFELSSRQTCPGGNVVLKNIPVAYRRVYSFVTFNDLFFERIVKRDTGRAFFGTAGRRSADVC